MTRWLSALIIVLLTACGSVTEPDATGDPVLSLVVPAAEFPRDPRTGDAYVPFSFRNEGDVTVHLPRCGDAVAMEAEQAQGEGWEQYSSAICPANLPMVPVAIGPGTSVTGRWYVREPGLFRLRIVAGCDCELRIGYVA